MKLIFACLLSVWFVGFAAAADVTGHWSGQAELNAPDGTSHTMPAFLDLKQDGAKVTGSGGSESGESLPLENVQFDGTNLSFSVTGPDGRIYKSTLALTSVNRLEGKLIFTIEGGNEVTAKLSLDREPAK